jgi:hypothetical protein
MALSLARRTPPEGPASVLGASSVTGTLIENAAIDPTANTTVGTTKAHPTPTRASARPATAGPASVPPLISEAVARLAAAASAVVSASRTTKAPCSGRTAAAISESRAVNVSTTPTGAQPRTAARVAADATQRAPMPMPRCS